MNRSLADLPDEPPPAELRIERVQPATVDAYLAVFEGGLSPSAAFTAMKRRLVSAFAGRPDAPSRDLVGWLDGEPVATATLSIGGGVAGLYSVAVTPDHRGRGYGRAMSLAALRLGADLGLELATLQSSPAGRPVYFRLGFEDAFEVVPYRHPAGRTVSR
jgi:GNAT superfamily N-acetyltransferase